MKIPSFAGALVLVLFAVGCSKAPERASVASPPIAQPAADAAAAKKDATDPLHANAEHGIAWQSGDVDAAFAKAKADGKPLFLYWGAVWCPPCNEVKATIFNRQDFIERSRFFVPVYVDGDAPSAQKLGARFKVSAYPTMVLFTPDGKEITRLPGEADADQYMQVLALGMNGARPIKETLAAALATGKAGGNANVSPDDWRMLAYYSWATDEKQLADDGKLPDTLQRLAKACPADQPQLATRLSLQALAAAAKAKGAKSRDDKAVVEMLLQVLADPRLGRENFDVVVYYADDIAGKFTLPGTPRRAQLTRAWNAALERLAADPNLSPLDRLTTVSAQVALAKLDAPKGKVPEALQKRVRDESARAVEAARDPYARRGREPGGGNAGRRRTARRVRCAAEDRNRAVEYALLLYARPRAQRQGARRQGRCGRLGRKGYASAKGPATRLQWGVRYVSLMIELTPKDAERIERAAAEVIGELEPSPDTFYERNAARSSGWARTSRPGTRTIVTTKRSGSSAPKWAVYARSCRRTDPAHAICEGTLRSASAAKA